MWRGHLSPRTTRSTNRITHALHASGVSSFQALAMSLSGRVGTGNVAGVATAIAFGGAGAMFWMWAVAFLGASTSFIESTLGQIYKTRDPLNDSRGYVNTKITKDALSADFRVLDYVTTPGSPVSTKASFAIQDGIPGLQVRA